MPKTKKKFNWEIYDESGEFIDILSMTRNEEKDYRQRFPKYKILEIAYMD